MTWERRNLINAEFADAWLYEPLKRAFVFMGAAERLVFVADMLSHKGVKNVGDSRSHRGRRAIVGVWKAVGIWCGAISSNMKVSFQAARSIG
jgi:hypothetical protein